MIFSQAYAASEENWDVKHRTDCSPIWRVTSANQFHFFPDKTVITIINPNPRRGIAGIITIALDTLLACMPSRTPSTPKR